jgi:hypothetical protein
MWHSVRSREPAGGCSAGSHRQSDQGLVSHGFVCREDAGSNRGAPSETKPLKRFFLLSHGTRHDVARYSDATASARIVATALRMSELGS